MHPRPKTRANTSKAAKSHDMAEAPVRDRHNSIGVTTKATDAVRTALVLICAKRLLGDKHTTPILIQTMSVTVEPDMMHTTTGSASTTVDPTQTAAMTNTTAIGITATTARGRAAKAGAQRETK